MFQFNLFAMLFPNKIQIIKKIICDNEHYDNDFWDFGGNEALQRHLHTFTALDWEKLQKELKAWTSFQKLLLAYALISPKVQFEQVDATAIYGYIFTLVEDREADPMIEEIEVLDNGKHKMTKLLIAVKERIIELKHYTESKKLEGHNYKYYLDLIDKLLLTAVN